MDETGRQLRSRHYPAWPKNRGWVFPMRMRTMSWCILLCAGAGAGWLAGWATSRYNGKDHCTIEPGNAIRIGKESSNQATDSHRAGGEGGDCSRLRSKRAAGMGSHKMRVSASWDAMQSATLDIFCVSARL